LKLIRILGIVFVPLEDNNSKGTWYGIILKEMIKNEIERTEEALPIS